MTLTAAAAAAVSAVSSTSTMDSNQQLNNNYNENENENEQQEEQQVQQQNKIESSTTMDLIAENYNNYYREKMIEFIYERPHLPPTLFELKLKHKQYKQNLMIMFEKQQKSRNQENSIKSINENDLEIYLQLLMDKIEKTFENTIMDLSAKEYRICQTGFVIGWKDNKQHNDNNKINSSNNKLSNYNQIINDRF